jgi:hypothetical protein
MGSNGRTSRPLNMKELHSFEITGTGYLVTRHLVPDKQNPPHNLFCNIPFYKSYKTYSIAEIFTLKFVGILYVFMHASTRCDQNFTFWPQGTMNWDNCLVLFVVLRVSGFNCPTNNPFPFGDHSRHTYPGSCSLFIMCLKDGSVKIGACSSGSAYSTATQNCEIAASVPGCSKFSQW